MGDGPSHAVLEGLRAGAGKVEDHLCYLTRTKDGKILKSTTLYLRDDAGSRVDASSMKPSPFCGQAVFVHSIISRPEGFSRKNYLP